MQGKKTEKTIPIFIGLNLLSWILIFFIPIQHAKILILLIFALTGWGMKVLPQAIVSLMIIVYIPILGVGSFEEGFQGFSQPFIWLLISTFLLASGVEKTGLGRRMALWLLLRANGKTSTSLLFTNLTLIILGLMIPTAAGRTAMLLPVCLGMVSVIKDEKVTKNYSKALMLSLAFTSSFLSWGLITGSSSSIYAVSFIRESTGFEWTYFKWLIFNFPIMIIIVLFLWIILLFLYPNRSERVMEAHQFIQKEYQQLGKMNIKEWKMCLIGLFTVVGWCTEPLHGYSISMIALVAGIMSCIPLIGVQTWEEGSKEISWDIVILFGAGFAMAEMIVKNETSHWIASKISGAFPDLNSFEAALLLIILITITRLGFANMLAITAVYLPITISLSAQWELNPVWLSQIVIIACSFGYFLPIQSPSNLIAYSSGYFSEKDLFKTGFYVTAVVIVIVIASSQIFWPVIGLKP